nr:ABC transporter ATP-binding protein [Pantoea sp. 201603H]
MNLQFTHVSLGYPGHSVLHDASFTLDSGTLTCLVGANGCGKTTLMRSILGVLPVENGEILLNGIPIDRLSPATRAKNIAWVPQAHDGAFAFRVSEMVMMGLTPYLSAFTTPGHREQALAYQKLDDMGIRHLAERRWTALSGGEKQLVLITRALVQQPQLLLMDEPASSLDFGHQIRLLDTVRTLRSQGITILMSTHHPLHARAVADSILCIQPNGAINQGSAVALLANDALAVLYGVSPGQIGRHLGQNHSGE